MSAKSCYAWLGLALLAAAPYLIGLQYPFVYDDHGVIAENAFLENPSHIIPTIKLRTLGDPEIVDGVRPVVIASYFADRALWKLRPVGYHLTNVALHVVAVLLLFAFARGFMSGRKYAFLAALLFAWHPLMVEPVQSPSFREEMLYTIFGLVFMLIGRQKASSLCWIAAALLAYVLALLSKEAAIVFPLLLGVVWWLYPEHRPAPPRMKVWLSLMACITAAWGWLVFIKHPVQQMGVEWNGLSFRGMECVWSLPLMLVWNLKKVVYPHPLSIDYRIEPLAGPFDPMFVTGLLAAVILVVLIWRSRHQHPAISLSLSWALLTFLPVSNLLPLFNPVADRYAYMQVPGIIFLVSYSLCLLSPRAWPVMIVVAGVYLGLILNRLPDWKNDRALWSSALKVEPGSARAHTWIGLDEKQSGRQASAWEHFSEAEMLNPHDPAPTVNKAVMLGEKGDLAASEEQLLKVLQRYPGNKAARKNMATCLRLQGRDSEAESYDRAYKKGQ